MKKWLTALLSFLRPDGEAGQQPSDHAAQGHRGCVPLETQLQKLRELGFALAEGLSLDDIPAFESHEELEATPYAGLIVAMGSEIEREPFTPCCPRLWMCDFECIEDHGDYRSVLLRLAKMVGGSLDLAEVSDHVDIVEGVAWLEFTHAGQHVRWELAIDNDWLDPSVLTRFDRLLEDSGSSRRLFLNPEDYGQSVLLVALTPREKARLANLSSLRWQPASSLGQ